MEPQHAAEVIESYVALHPSMSDEIAAKLERTRGNCKVNCKVRDQAAKKKSISP
jgi:hypothetical protein